MHSHVHQRPARCAPAAGPRERGKTESETPDTQCGASRTFRFKPKKGHQGDDLDLELGHGDLLLMEPPTQQHWLHGLPKRLRVDQSRLNLTFRVVQQA